MQAIRITLLALISHAAVAAANTFTGTDFSGSYDCTGTDRHDGNFKGSITLQLVRAQSHDDFAAYNIRFEAEGFGGYNGYAAARGNQMALFFANNDPKTKDFGNSIVSMTKNKNGKWQLESFYYEPEYFGGNYGSEMCVMR